MTSDNEEDPMDTLVQDRNRLLLNEMLKEDSQEDSNPEQARHHASFVSSEGSDDHDVSIQESEGTSNGDTEIREVERQARAENRQLQEWRFVVAVVLLGTGIALTATIYAILCHVEISQYEEALRHTTHSLQQAIGSHQTTLRHALKGMSEDISRYVKYSNNASWPLVTLPGFAQASSRFLELIDGAESLVILPKVSGTQRIPWELYAQEHYEEWVEEGHEYADDKAVEWTPTEYHSTLTTFEDGIYEVAETEAEYFPLWTMAPPPPTYAPINRNLKDIGGLDLSAISEEEELWTEAVVSTIQLEGALTIVSSDDSDLEPTPSSFWGQAISSGNEMVGMIVASVQWNAVLTGALPRGVDGVHVVVRSTCEDAVTFLLNGPIAEYLGEGDFHDHDYDDELSVARFDTLLLSRDSDDDDFGDIPGHCLYRAYVYPSAEFRKRYRTFVPELLAVIVAVTFILVAIVFLVYDIFVQNRNRKIISTAARSNAIVSSMFPAQLRDRLLGRSRRGHGNEEESEWGAVDASDHQGNSNNRVPQSARNIRSAYLTGTTAPGTLSIKTPKQSKPVAELYLETSIIFADIVGFTAWASSREPTQVFELLESAFAKFDHVARSRNIFKVETVGDCYVAVSGLPERRPDHAQAMIRFGMSIVKTFIATVQLLEVTLGPDTGDLQLRVGIHSGPVTGGVLRGDRARFQLFGDTMNTAARMESTGLANRIQVSEETAKLLPPTKRNKWLIPREKAVEAKGKGLLHTYWVNPMSSTGYASTTHSSSKDNEDGDSQLDGSESFCSAETDTQRPTGPNRPMFRQHSAMFRKSIKAKMNRLIDWNTETLLRAVKQIVGRRRAIAALGASHKVQRAKEGQPLEVTDSNALPLDGVHEIIPLPKVDNALEKSLDVDVETVVLDASVAIQLRELVAMIAGTYKSNAFHNFEHASHVTLSVMKLLSRIGGHAKLSATGTHGCDTTYGITADPLIPLACAFSALIHDADHQGVPNTQLVEESQEIAAYYKNRSVAEQNSLDVCWKLLLLERFDDLRQVLFETPVELNRFRALVVNAVMATDIADKELKVLRNNRWDKAFADDISGLSSAESCHLAQNRKATIVIEHLMQASDISHTMQHWHVYRKWNERLFEELYVAYQAGRSTVNPADVWVKGELSFFDFYIIPLAKKLKECGVFGVSSDEFLNYAVKNRQEWEDRGQEVVDEMIEKFSSAEKAQA